MHPGHSHPPFRRVARFALLAAGLALYSITLTQCQMVKDNITGVDVFARKPAAECIHDCKQDAKAAVIDENQRFREELRECRGNATCIDQQIQLHVQILTQIASDLENCLGSCHHQGGGTGGN